MARIQPMELIASISGSVCGHDAVYMRTRKSDGATFAVKLCNPVTPNSTDQVAQQNKFKTVAAAIKALTPEQKADYKAAWSKLKGKAFPTLSGYIFKQEYAKLA